MPRGKSSSSSALAIREVQRQAGSVLAELRRDMRRLENELAQLRRDEEMMVRFTTQGMQKGSPAGATKASAAGNVASRRINWKNVLAQLPKQFQASNVRQVRGLKNKRPSEIFAAITRWIEAGMIKRRARAHYEKLSNEPNIRRTLSKAKPKLSRT